MAARWSSVGGRSSRETATEPGISNERWFDDVVHTSRCKDTGPSAGTKPSPDDADAQMRAVLSASHLRHLRISLPYAPHYLPITSIARNCPLFGRRSICALSTYT